MKSIARTIFVGSSVACLLAALASSGIAKPTPEAGYAPVDKIIKAHCVGCHQGAKPAAQVDLSSYAAVMKSKFKGKPIVVAKKVKDSILSKALHGTGMAKMPPGGPLSPADVKTIEAWIAAGAKK